MWIRPSLQSNHKVFGDAHNICATVVQVAYFDRLVFIVVHGVHRWIMLRSFYSGCVHSTSQHYESKTFGMNLPGKYQLDLPCSMTQVFGNIRNEFLPSSSGGQARAMTADSIGREGLPTPTHTLLDSERTATSRSNPETNPLGLCLS